jgi:hypothetical protein
MGGTRMHSTVINEPRMARERHGMKVKSLLMLVAGFIAGICATRASASLLQRAPVPDAVVASPEQYKLEFENEFVRVIRVTYGPHAKMVLHQHPAPGGIVVTLTDQDALITAPDGRSREVHYKAGQFRWGVSTPGADRSSQSAHQEENLSDKPFEMIRIEPKPTR